jgi:pimeloyl-ACP methyl ester carboxylesterase
MPIPTPYPIHVPLEVLDDLEDRLRRTRYALDVPGDDWSYGFDSHYLRELVTYWVEDYDFRAVEARINELQHFRTTIDDVPLHFVHERGKGPDPMPLLLHHGWPWTFWDYRKVIGPLTDPAAHGGDPHQSFDVVLCSLPGFGFSGPLTRRGVNFHVTADIEHTLMTDVLGYDRFGTAGGDWGALIAAQLGHKFASSIIGVYSHLPMPLSLYLREHLDVPPGIRFTRGMPDPSEYGQDEQGWVEQNARFVRESGYSHVQRSAPQTIGAALADSPSGQLAWIAEKRLSWADTGRDITSVWTKEDLITAATIYWVTNTGASSARYYKETMANPWKPSHRRFPVVEAPTALGVFPADIQLMPRRWSEKYHNLQQYRVHNRGGHFAPYEQPQIYLEDVRTFFATLRC